LALFGNWLGRSVWWCLIALWLWPLALPVLDSADSVGHLAPAVSLASDADLFYLDEYVELGMGPRYFVLTPRSRARP
jgi:hypothetical protein